MKKWTKLIDGMKIYTSDQLIAALKEAGFYRDKNVFKYKKSLDKYCCNEIAIFIWLFSISDIKTKNSIGHWLIYIAMVIVFLLRFCMMCSLAVNRVPAFMIESIIIFIVLNILSKALKNRIGSGDFDIACIICLSIGPAGMFFL